VNREEGRSAWAGIGRHLRSNAVGYVALLVALTMTPIPTYASHLVVRTSDILDGAVTGAKIRDGAVTRAKIRDGAVTSTELANGAVTFDKLADGVVDASKLASIAEFKATKTRIGTTATWRLDAACPGGTRVIGGGFDASPLWRVHQSMRSGNGWRVIATFMSTGDDFLPDAFAYCLSFLF
jgi:hypothetical protein